MIPRSVSERHQAGFQVMSVYPGKNIKDLPMRPFREIVNIMVGKEHDFLASLPDNPFQDWEIQRLLRYNQRSSPVENILQELGTKGKNVEYLIQVLDAMGLERPQLSIRKTEPIRMVQQPEGEISVNEGQILSIWCEGQSFPYPKYQWYKADDRGEFQKISAANRGTYEVSNLSLSDGGHYQCTLYSDNDNVMFSDVCHVTVTPLPEEKRRLSPVTPVPAAVVNPTGDQTLSCPIDYGSYNYLPGPSRAPLILLQPVSCRVKPLEEFVLTCEGQGHPPPTYQWIKDGMALEGENKPQLTVIKATESHGGNYCCELSNMAGTQRTNHVNVLISTSDVSFPEIVRHPIDVETRLGSGVATFCCEVSVESEPITYQWYHNGVKMQGETSGTLYMKNLTEKDMGDYQCKIKNCYGKRMSKTAKLSLKTGSLHEFTATDKVALVIGNHSYKSERPLYAPQKDVQEVKVALTALDFKVVSLVNLTKTELEKMVDIFCELIDQGVYAVFYFAGHGFEESGQCYLVPYDAPANYGPSDCTCAENVLKKIQNRSPGLCLMLLDICRKSNPPRKEKDQPVYKPDVLGNVVFGYATSFQMSAYEEAPEINNEDNAVSGIFVKHLIKYISNDVDVVTMLGEVNTAVGLDKDASHLQFPEIRANLRGKHCLTDAINSRGQTHVYTRRAVEWAKMTEVPKTHEVDLKELNLKIELRFHAETCNVLHIEPVILDKGITQCQVWIEAPQHYQKTQYSADGLPIRTPRVVIRDMQTIQENLVVTVCIRYNVESFENFVSQSIDIGRPLISSCNLNINRNTRQLECTSHKQPVEHRETS